jgi:pimeloyl-ACP methyl ester carboxylesterase
MARTLFALVAVLLSSTAAWSQPTTKTVDVRADDGTILKATYASPGKPGPGVILMHMCNSKRQAWDTLLPLLTAKGLHVLAVDYRGYGESGGKAYTTWTPEERAKITNELWPKDLDRVLAFLGTQPGVDKARIGAAGGSCGVNNAIQLARRHPEVTTLVLLAGGTDDEGSRFLERAPWIPIFAAAAHDDGGAVATTGWVMGFSSNPSNTLKEYAKGGHGTELFPVHKDLQPAIAAWLERHLITKPVKATPKAAPRPGPSAKIAAQLRAPGGVAKLTAAVRSAKKSGRKVSLPPEGAVNAMGYARLQANEAKEAIELFTLNVEAHPASANAYDSLADGYVGLPDPAKAALYAQKALDALPGDKSLNDEVRKQIRESAEAKIKAKAK